MAKFTKPKTLINENERLAELYDLQILDTDPEANLDDITYLASQICQTPIALISLVDSTRQWFKSRVGLTTNETPRDISFCGHAIHQSKPFIVEDTLKDDRFMENPLVTGAPYFRFYAGAQLRTSNGFNIGTLCVIDQKPNHLSVQQIKSLEALARQTISIFEAKRKLLETREQQYFFSNIVNALPDLIFHVDLNYCYKFTNASYEKWFNLDRSRTEGKSMAEVIGDGAFMRVKPYLDRALNGEQLDFQLTLPYLVQGQTHNRTVNVIYRPERSHEGKVVGIFGVVRDITALKFAEYTAEKKSEELTEALKDSLVNQESFRAIFDNSPMGLARVDHRYKFKLVNSALANMLGYSVEELIGISVVDITHPDDRAVTLEQFKTFPTGTGLLNRFRKRYFHKSGNTIWVQICSKAIKFSNEEQLSLFSVIENVTEVIEKESALANAQVQLVNTAKMTSLGEMARGMAHEINNPLSIIQGKSFQIRKMIEKGLFDPKLHTKELLVIDEAVFRIATIIQGLRVFSTDAKQDHFKVLDISKLIEDTLIICRERIKVFGIKLTVNCPPNLKAECRRGEMSQALLNILHNASDAIEKLPVRWIDIEVTEKEDRLSITIRDSGPGIPKEVVDKLTSPFFTTKTTGKGTGLGLSITKGIIDGHQGLLKYKEIDGHTAFLVEIPKSQTLTPQVLSPLPKKSA